MSKAWRAIHERPAGNFWSISYNYFHFLDRGRQVYMGKKLYVANVLRGPLLARGSEVSRAIYQGTAGHFWPAGQGLKTTHVLGCAMLQPHSGGDSNPGLAATDQGQPQGGRRHVSLPRQEGPLPPRPPPHRRPPQARQN